MRHREQNTVSHETGKIMKLKLKWIVTPVLIAAAATIVVTSKKNVDIPENLMGKWTTSAPRYEDRFFDITRETLTYGIGGDKEDVYFISSIKKLSEGKNTLYTIDYKNKDGLEFTCSLSYHPENGGIIQFKHQENVQWRRITNAEVR
jgi:hypothetical protein